MGGIVSTGGSGSMFQCSALGPVPSDLSLQQMQSGMGLPKPNGFSTL